MQVSFHILEDATVIKAYQYVCNLVEKAYLQGKRIFIYMNSYREAEKLDHLLWTFKDISFIPHEIVKNVLETGTSASSLKNVPVQIGFADINGFNVDSLPENFDLLINLQHEFPIAYHHYDDIFEIVFNDALMQQYARIRFKKYRELNFKINTYKIKVNEYDNSRENL